MYSTIVCPVGLNKESFTALPQAARLAEAFEAELTLLHLNPEFLSSEEMQMLRTSTAKEHEKIRRMAVENRETIEALLEELGQKDAVGRIELREGNPEKDIAECAEDLGADLIVISSAGRNRLNELIVGATAERVLRDANVDVFVVRQEK